MAIKMIRIFPPIGIARVGNSENEFFLAAETPGNETVPPGGYRDQDHHIKPQGVRYHLFGYDEADKLVREITTDDGQITWKVHLANTKASAEWFGRKTDPKKLRNKTIRDRASLNLDAGEQTIAGINPDFPDLLRSRQSNHAKDLRVNKVLFGKQISVKLGTILTDDKGRLVVCGGEGKAESPTGRQLQEPETPEHDENFANHDEWFDDIADGRIDAVVKLSDGTTPAVKSAWVISAPPKYAPTLRHPVTLYDTLLQAMVDRKDKSGNPFLPDPTAAPGYQPVFSRDILPILQRAFDLRWTFANGAATIKRLRFHNLFTDFPPDDRETIFGKLGVPSDVAGAPAKGGGNMPKMWSDAFVDDPPKPPPKPPFNGTLTKIQYKNMSLWRAGSFFDDSQNPPTPSSAITPEGLTEAALQPCIGAPFYPGIEASWKLRDEYPFIEPFRLDAQNISPGDISKQMSLPWQSDFLDCGAEAAGTGQLLVWWPAQRPMDVISKSTGDSYIRWAREHASDTMDMSPDVMATKWWRLGLLLKQADDSVIEDDRVPDDVP